HLLRDLAIVAAANLTPVERNKVTTSTTDFWVHARLTTGDEALFELGWTGYESSYHEAEYAKPRAAVRLAFEAVKGLEFKKHSLTAGERASARGKFAKDWSRLKTADSYWWVRERYIQTVGVVGDERVLPVLRDILAADPPNGNARQASDGRCVYYAINAAT